MYATFGFIATQDYEPSHKDLYLRQMLALREIALQRLFNQALVMSRLLNLERQIDLRGVLGMILYKAMIHCNGVDNRISSMEAKAIYFNDCKHKGTNTE